ncbi:hypothetical protein GSI_13307 [Ganoderma sinense ZZ0214-1]|uniref:Uncharacterized protein n=1 Tax=Ganoderma sinense ZZ0214-1 TaxID=1077348 RepID=A0A2G8RV79_9APHY|nr:hypothetical protein GSI_13307 [Ganoderma sinense ZZ0214-1]
MARTNLSLRSSIIWDAHETNWRCELLALDALMVRSNQWPELERWMRESLLSHVWGSGTSGIDVLPPSELQTHSYCWLQPPQEGWEECRGYLKAFVEILSRWDGLPSELKGAHQQVMTCDADEYIRVLSAAVSFYVHTFVAKYERLPSPPRTGLQEIRVENGKKVDMGATKWRAQELILLEKVAASDEGQKQLKKSHTDRREGRTYWFRNATNLFVMKYREAFSGCFEEESEVEFAYRQQRQRYAKLERYLKETEVERDKRLNIVNKRIESWLKSQSGGRSRRKQGDGSSAINPSTMNENAASPPHVPARTTVSMPVANAPIVPFASTHTFEENAHSVFAPGSVHAGELAMSSRDATPTDEQLRKLLTIVKEILLTLMKDRGWVGWCLLGGLDSEGKLANAHECTTYNKAELGSSSKCG